MCSVPTVQGDPRLRGEWVVESGQVAASAQTEHLFLTFTNTLEACWGVDPRENKRGPGADSGAKKAET